MDSPGLSWPLQGTGSRVYSELMPVLKSTPAWPPPASRFRVNAPMLRTTKSRVTLSPKSFIPKSTASLATAGSSWQVSAEVTGSIRHT